MTKIDKMKEEFWEKWKWGSVYYAGPETGRVTIAGKKEEMLAGLGRII